MNKNQILFSKLRWMGLAVTLLYPGALFLYLNVGRADKDGSSWGLLIWVVMLVYTWLPVLILNIALLIVSIVASSKQRTMLATYANGIMTFSPIFMIILWLAPLGFWNGQL